MNHYIATATFGLEAVVKREVMQLGAQQVKVLDGRVDFLGEAEILPRANLWLRSADRVLLVLGEFKTLTFDELFEKTKALPWEDWIPKDGKFTVTGKSIKSTLFSVPDCQSIVKKAVVEKLKQKYHIEWFPETGAEYTIQVALLKDMATLTIDTTGPGLHKRGYRKESLIAPLKETLAAALIDLSYWRKDRLLLDPFCGSGTIPIEAALKAKNIAPGLSRSFVSEQWDTLPPEIWKTARKECYEKIDVDFTPNILGYDIDPKAIELAKHNARKAGVDDCIRFYEKPIQSVTLEEDYGVLISNPPYGMRMGEKKEVEKLYQALGAICKKNPTWSVYIITSHEEFETFYGAKANKKRKLFNGRLKTDYYQFEGKRPPKKS